MSEADETPRGATLDGLTQVNCEDTFKRVVEAACRVMLVQRTSATHLCRNAGQANCLSNNTLTFLQLWH